MATSSEFRPNPDEDDRDSDLRATASRWVAKRDGNLSASELARLQEWLAASKKHAAAFARADRDRSEVDWPLYAGRVNETLRGLEARERTRSLRRLRLATAGALAAVVLATSIIWRTYPPRKILVEPVPPSLIVLAPEKQTLPDGSVVELKNGSSIQVDFSAARRSIILERGTALFQVAKDRSRPFVVRAGTITAQAVGTAFVMELNASTVSVLVTKGTVAVDEAIAPPDTASLPAPAPAASLAVLGAGRSMLVPMIGTAISKPQINTVATTAMEEQLSWRIPLLEFTRTPLKDIVRIVNPYNTEKMVIADPSLENLPLSGVLRADQIEALVNMLQDDFRVRVRRSDGQIILSK